MKVTFLGTGTSMGVPVAGSFGRECGTGDSRDDRMRTSAWVQSDEASILIDVGPEFRLQSIRSRLKKIDLILITHEHADHVGGLDDLRPYNYVQNGAIPVITSESCQKSIRSRFPYMFEPGKTPGSVDMNFLPIRKTRFLDCEITPFVVSHGLSEVLGFRINDFVYITDAHHLSEEAYHVMEGARALVLNGLRWSPPHPTHLTIPEAVEVAKKSGISSVYLVHMSQEVLHADTNRRLPHGISLAYDMLEIEC